MTTMKEHLRDLVQSGKPISYTMMTRAMSRRWLEAHTVPAPMTLWAWFFGRQDVEPIPKKKQQPRGHRSTGPDPFLGLSVRDGRGNRTGEPIRRKLTDGEVREIRWLCTHTGGANKRIAARYEVSRETISHIRHGRRHKRVIGMVRPGWWRGERDNLGTTWGQPEGQP